MSNLSEAADQINRQSRLRRRAGRLGVGIGTVLLSCVIGLAFHTALSAHRFAQQIQESRYSDCVARNVRHARVLDANPEYRALIEALLPQENCRKVTAP